MRIYDVNLTGSAATESARAQETQRSDRSGSSKTGIGGAGGPGDRVEFSGTLGRLSQAIAADSSTRANRVQALATQHQSGKYRPDSVATSKSIVAEALATGSKS